MVRVAAFLVCFALFVSAFTISFQVEQNATGSDDYEPEPLAAVTFTNVTPSVGLSGVSGNFFAWGDYNNDGYQDLLVNGRRLFKNSGPPSWTFTEVTTAAGITGGSQGTWGDYDNDGYLDLYAPGADILWHNNGDGTFSDVTTAAGNIRDTYNSVACGWGDYDADGFIDLYIANYEDADLNGYPDALWHNEGNGTFRNVTSEAGIIESEPSRGVSWGDYDDDGDLDIYISNYRIRPNHLWENTGNGTFVNVAVDKGVDGHETVRLGTSYYGHTVGSAWADYDNDGDLDMWSTNLAHKDLLRGPICDDSYMFRNNGPGENYNFTDLRQFTNIPTKNIGGGEDELMVGVAWGDYDNDGYLDLFLPQIYFDVPYAYSYLYHNDGDGTFTEVSNATGVRVWDTYGGAWADYNNDGWLDLVTGGKGEASENGTHELHLYRNNGNSNNWLQVTLKGTNSNAAAIGARVTVTVGNLTQVREVEGGMGSHSMQNSLTLEYGMSSRSGLAGISIRWPTGLYLNQTGVSLNQHITIIEEEVLSDLAVTDLAISRLYPVAGDNVELKATIKNLGEGLARSAKAVFYEHPGTGDGSVVIAEVAVPKLDSGLSTFAYANWDTTGKSGDYELSVAIEDVSPADSDLTNNNLIVPINVRSTNALPKAVLDASPTLAGIGDPILFNGSGSTDDIEVTLYRFYYGDGQDSDWLTTPLTQHIYSMDGVYGSYLVVEDYDGAISDMNSSAAGQKITISADIINNPPVINNVDFTPTEVSPGGTVKISVDAYDADGDELTYFYNAEAGEITGSGSQVNWKAPDPEGSYAIGIHVSDGRLESERTEIDITVSSTASDNKMPVIDSFSVTPVIIAPNGVAAVSVSAFDPEGNDLLYRYSTTGGTITGNGPEVKYIAPGGEGNFQISVVVNDGELDSMVTTTTIEVFQNDPPEISSITSDPEVAETNEQVEVQAIAKDADGHKLTFAWTADDGVISGTGSIISWTAPDVPGDYDITVTVSDTHGAEAEASVSISVIYPQGGPDIVRIDIMPASVGNDGTEDVLITVEVSHPADPAFIESVIVDLSEVGGGRSERLYDNGRKGDEKAGDGIYSLRFSVSYGTPEGTVELRITAEDIDRNTETDTSTLVIKNVLGVSDASEPIISNSQLAIIAAAAIVVILIIVYLFFFQFRNEEK